MRTRASAATLCMLVAGLGAACGQVVPLVSTSADSNSVAQPAQVASGVARPTPNPTVAPAPAAARSTTATNRLVPVVRDSIDETLNLDGVVVPQEQVPITYPLRALVDVVRVRAGQSVKQGDPLLDLNGAEISRSLDAARAHLQVSQGNLAQGRANLQASAQRAAADQQQRQQAVIDAESALRAAQDNVRIVQAGKSAGERDAQVTAVTSNTAIVRQAQDALNAALAGPSADTIRAAQREVAADQAAVSKAQADLDTLTRGPDPTAMRSAQSALQRAQTQLQLAQTSKIDPKADQTYAALQHDAAIQDAQLGVQNAQAAVSKLKEPPSEADVSAARQRVQDGQDALDKAQAHLDALQSGPDPEAVKAAQVGLERARHALAEAQANLDEVNSHPTVSEMAAATDQVRRAQAALDAARQTVDTSDVTVIDIDALQSAVDQDQSEVTRLEALLQSLHILAPFDGTVVAVRVKSGDGATPTKPLIMLARPDAPIVTVDLTDPVPAAARLLVGQQATVQFDDGTQITPPVAATVASLTPAPTDATSTTRASATFQVSWADGQAPRFGTPAQVRVTLGQKQDVLVVPKSAVHRSNGRSTVEVQDGNLRKVVTVQVGVTTDTTVEIVSGLTEGQTVLAGPA